MRNPRNRCAIDVDVNNFLRRRHGRGSLVGAATCTLVLAVRRTCYSDSALLSQPGDLRKHPVRTAGSRGHAARAASVLRQFQGSNSAIRLAG